MDEKLLTILIYGRVFSCHPPIIIFDMPDNIVPDFDEVNPNLLLKGTSLKGPN
jgi:hypothetical protein